MPKLRQVYLIVGVLTLPLGSCKPPETSQNDQKNIHPQNPSFGGNQKEIPPEGIVVEDYNEQGDPANAEEDFRRLFAVINAYRQKFNAFPSLAQINDTSKPLVEGFQLTKEDLDNPDRKYIKTMHPKENFYTFHLDRPRPDGKAKPVFPKVGEKDVWVLCNRYARTFRRELPDRTTESEEYGCYVVLWSDGSIERVPQTKVLTFVRDGSYKAYFPGTTGLPKDAQLMSKYRQSRGLKVKYTLRPPQ